MSEMWFQLLKSVYVLRVKQLVKLVFWELLLVSCDHCTTWPLQIHLAIDSGAIEMYNSRSKDVNGSK